MIINGSKFHNLKEKLVYVRVGNDMIGRRSGFKYFKLERSPKDFGKLVNEFIYKSRLVKDSNSPKSSGNFVKPFNHILKSSNANS